MKKVQIHTIDDLDRFRQLISTRRLESEEALIKLIKENIE